MALKRSASVGAITLCVALAAGNEAYGHNRDDGVAGGNDRSADAASAGRRHSGKGTLVARRGFGATGRTTAPSGGE